MTDNSVNQLPTGQERIVSPQTLADLFHTSAEGMLSAGKAQRFGSYVVACGNQAGIRQHPVRERVTHAKLVSTSAATGPVVTHEVHFPSRGKEADDFEAGTAIFETHEYDEAGQRVGTERKVIGQVDMAGPEIRPFVEQIDGLNNKP